VVDKKGDGVFVTAVLLIVAIGLMIAGFGGLGSEQYGSFALSLLLGAGGITYFALKGAESFGMEARGAWLNGVIALAGALVFTTLFVRGTTVLATIAGAVVIACAVPIVAFAIRSGKKPVVSS